MIVFQNERIEDPEIKTTKVVFMSRITPPAHPSFQRLHASGHYFSG